MLCFENLIRTEFLELFMGKYLNVAEQQQKSLQQQ